jgi:hypothetical protein
LSKTKITSNGVISRPGRSALQIDVDEYHMANSFVSGTVAISGSAKHEGFMPNKLVGYIPSQTTGRIGPGLFNVAAGGYYYVDCSTPTTGTLPPADQLTGAMMIFIAAYNKTFDLTASNRVIGVNYNFIQNNTIGSGSFGDRLRIGGFATVILISDGFEWILLGGQGPSQIGFPAF